MPSDAGGVDRLGGEHVADGLLERGGDVGDRHRLAGLLAGLHPPGDGGLQAGEGEVEAVPLEVAARGEAAREVDRHRGAGRRGPVDVRPAGERQPEQPGDLVERLAGRVVDGGAHRLDGAGHVVDPQQRGVAAADQHRQAALGQRPVLELVDGDVGGEVVHAVQRLVEPDRQRLRRGDADQQRTGEPGPAVTARASTSVERDPGGRAGALDGRHHRLEVGA